MYEWWLESTPRMFVLSSKSAVFYEIKKGEFRSTEVQKYSEKQENDFTSHLLGDIIHSLLLYFYTPVLPISWADFSELVTVQN